MKKVSLVLLVAASLALSGFAQDAVDTEAAPELPKEDQSQSEAPKAETKPVQTTPAKTAA